MHRVDYEAHDGVYRRLRAKGDTGWDDRAAFEEHIGELRWAIPQLRPAGSALLELGCGAGDVSQWLAGEGFSVHGIDISQAAVDWAIDRTPKGVSAKFTVGNVCDLGFNGTFDVVLDGHCLHCIIGPDRPRVLHSAYMALKTGGRIHIAHMTPPEARWDQIARYDPATKRFIMDGFARRQFATLEELASELESAGFSVLASKEIKAATEVDTPMALLIAEKK